MKFLNLIGLYKMLKKAPDTRFLDWKVQNTILEKSTFLSIFRCKWYSIDIQD